MELTCHLPGFTPEWTDYTVVRHHGSEQTSEPRWWLPRPSVLCSPKFQTTHMGFCKWSYMYVQPQSRPHIQYVLYPGMCLHDGCLLPFASMYMSCRGEFPSHASPDFPIPLLPQKRLVLSQPVGLPPPLCTPPDHPSLVKPCPRNPVPHLHITVYIYGTLIWATPAYY